MVLDFIYNTLFGSLFTFFSVNLENDYVLNWES